MSQVLSRPDFPSRYPVRGASHRHAGKARPRGTELSRSRHARCGLDLEQHVGQTRLFPLPQVPACHRQDADAALGAGDDVQGFESAIRRSLSAIRESLGHAQTSLIQKVLSRASLIPKYPTSLERWSQQLTRYLAKRW